MLTETGHPGRGERELAGCPDCGALQIARRKLATGVTVYCAVCGAQLERTCGRSLDAALACAFATFLLLISANLAPFLSTSVFGVSRQSYLGSAASAMWRDGWPSLAIVIALFLVVFPLVRFALLVAVLSSLRWGRRPGWLGPAFRWSNALRIWAMPDVFLLALWVAGARLAATISVHLETGAACFIGAGLLTLFTRATLDRAAVWRAIGPNQEFIPAGNSPLSCPGCNLLLPVSQEDRPCPRCAARVQARKPGAVSRAAALTVASLLLYVPANIYPIATLPIKLTPTAYTILEGVKDLFQAKLVGLGILVFSASFLILMLKLAALMWCIASVLHRSPRHLVAKTRLFGAVTEIGRWSMVDPFVIGVFVPVMDYNTFLHGSAGPAAPAFTGVVVLTMLAARFFDPRMMWDVARTKP